MKWALDGFFLATPRYRNGSVFSAENEIYAQHELFEASNSGEKWTSDGLLFSKLSTHAPARETDPSPLWLVVTSAFSPWKERMSSKSRGTVDQGNGIMNPLQQHDERGEAHRKFRHFNYTIHGSKLNVWAISSFHSSCNDKTEIRNTSEQNYWIFGSSSWNYS